VNPTAVDTESTQIDNNDDDDDDKAIYWPSEGFCPV
jgi:hypothetical protein